MAWEPPDPPKMELPMVVEPNASFSVELFEETDEPVVPEVVLETTGAV